MYVGLDVHKKFCYGTMMNEKGGIVKHEKFSRDPRCLGEFMDGVDEATVVMEAGYCWQPVYEWLEKDGYRVKLAHPTKTKAIAKAKVKTDKINSKILAHLLRADLVPESSAAVTPTKMTKPSPKPIPAVIVILYLLCHSFGVTVIPPDSPFSRVLSFALTAIWDYLVASLRMVGRSVAFEERCIFVS